MLLLASLLFSTVVSFDVPIAVDTIGHSSNVVMPGVNPNLGHVQAIYLDADIEGHATSTLDNFTSSPCHVWLGAVPFLPQLQHNRAGLKVSTHLGFDLFTKILDLPDAESVVPASSSVTLHQDATGALRATLVWHGDAQVSWMRPGVLTLNIERPGLFTETDDCGLIHREDHTESGGVLHFRIEYGP